MYFRSVIRKQIIKYSARFCYPRCMTIGYADERPSCHTRCASKKMTPKYASNLVHWVLSKQPVVHQGHWIYLITSFQAPRCCSKTAHFCLYCKVYHPYIARSYMCFMSPCLIGTERGQYIILC